MQRSRSFYAEFEKYDLKQNREKKVKKKNREKN